MVRELLPALLQSLPLMPGEADALLHSGLPFESFVEVVTSNIGSGILQLFAGGEPTTTHRWLAKLMRAGRLRTIVTTNFDCLIETALAEEGATDVDHLHRPEHYEHIDWSEPRPRLIKIHGTIDDEASLAATIAGVAAGPAVRKRIPVIEHVFGTAGGDPTIVLGYSCSDIFDISPAIEAIADPGRVICIEHASYFAIEDIGRAMARNPFRAHRGKRLFGDTTEVVRILWERTIDEAPYEHRRIEHPWRKRLDEWRQQVETTGGDGALEFLAGSVCSLVSDYAGALLHYRRGAEVAAGQWRAVNLMNAGGALFDSSRLREARHTFEQARDELRALGNVVGEIEVLRRLATIAQQQGRIIEAGDALGAAARLAEEHPDRVHPSFGTHLLLDQAGMENRVGWHRDALARAQLAHEIANEIGDLMTDIRALDAIASAHANLGEIDDALRAHERAVALARDLGNRFNEIIHLGKMASCLRMLDRLAEAAAVCDEALALARAIGDRGGEHDALVESGNIALQQERCADARTLWTESLEIADELSDATRRGISLGNLAACCEVDQDYDEAVGLREAALAEFVRVGERKLIDETHESIARLHLRRHDYARAREAFTAALESYSRRADADPAKLEELRQAVQHASVAASAPERFARVLAKLGHVEEAKQVCRIALENVRNSSDLWRQARVGGELATLEAEHGDPERAIVLGEESVRLFHEAGDPGNAACMLVNLGGAYERHGDYASAIRCYSEALPDFDDANTAEGVRDRLKFVRHSWRKELVRQGEAALSENRLNEARHYYETALRIARELGDPIAVGNNLGHLAAVLTSRDDYAGALRLYEEALVVLTMTNDRFARASARGNVGTSHQHLGNIDEAIACYEDALSQFDAIGEGDHPHAHVFGGNLSKALLELGADAFNAGKHDVARAYFLRCEAVCSRMGDVFGTVRAIINHAAIDWLRDDNKGNVEFARARDVALEAYGPDHELTRLAQQYVDAHRPALL